MKHRNTPDTDQEKAWNLLIAEAKERIADLRRSITFFEEQRDIGVNCPVDAESQDNSSRVELVTGALRAFDEGYNSNHSDQR